MQNLQTSSAPIGQSLSSTLLPRLPLSVPDRIKWLKKLSDLISQREPEILRALREDLGKPVLEAYVGECAPVQQEIQHILRDLPRWASPQKVSSPWWKIGHWTAQARIEYRPLGRVLILSPWNYPFNLSMMPVIGAFAAGNTFILKPSEQAPATAQILEDLIQRWIPGEWGHVLQGEASLAQKLCEDSWGHLFFTGSTSIGKKVMDAAAQTLTPVTLELGGKSPCFIDGDLRNLETALRRIWWGKMYCAGQTCVAPDYLLIPRKRLEEVKTLSQKILREFFGESALTSPDYGRIVHRRHFDRLRQYLDTRKILVGGRLSEATLKIEPTLLEPLSENDPLLTEEIFGPLLPFILYDSEADAVKEIEKRPNPLAFYIFSENEDLCRRLLDAIDCGGVGINDTLVHLSHPHLPFGGIKTSGIGKYHGRESFLTFSHSRAIEKKSLNADISLRYPPYKISPQKWNRPFI